MSRWVAFLLCWQVGWVALAWRFLAWVWDRTCCLGLGREIRMIPHISHILLLLLWERSFFSNHFENRGRTYWGTYL